MLLKTPMSRFWYFGQHAQLAYEGYDSVQSQSLSWGYDRCEFFDHKDTQAYFMTSKSHSIIALRGTEPDKLRDWLTDLDARLVPGVFGWVHAGCSRALDNVWPDLFLLARESRVPLILTGHSLGGMLATQLLARLIDANVTVDRLCTFAPPRSGDNVFARALNHQFKQAWYFVNNNDIVPRIPRTRGYSHVGRMMYFTRRKELLENPSWWRLLTDRVAGRFRRPIADGIRDHSMTEYLHCMARNSGHVPTNLE